MTLLGETTVTVPEGGTLKPGGTVRTGDGPEMTLPQGGTADEDGNVTADEIEVGNTTVKGENVTVDPDGNINVPDGGTVTPPSGPDITLPEGGTVDKDGNIIPDGGSAQVGDYTITAPDTGSTLKPDGNGNVEISAGSTVTDSKGKEKTVPSQPGLFSTARR